MTKMLNVVCVCRDMERKYQDKISSLQAQIEKEREMISSQASNQTTKLLDEMEQLRGDEALSKERLQNILEVGLVHLNVHCERSLQNDRHDVLKQLIGEDGGILASQFSFGVVGVSVKSHCQGGIWYNAKIYQELHVF